MARGKTNIEIVVGIEVESLKKVLKDNIEDNFDILWSTLFSDNKYDLTSYLEAGTAESCRDNMLCLRDDCLQQFNEHDEDDRTLIRFLIYGEERKDKKTLLCPIHIITMEIIDYSMTYSSLCIDDFEITDEHRRVLNKIAFDLKIKDYKIKRWINYSS